MNTLTRPGAMYTPPLFLTFGYEVVVGFILIGVLWLVFLLIQIGTGFLAIKAGWQGRWARAALWGVLCFILVAAFPLKLMVDVYRAEAAMEQAAIRKSLPDLSGASLLFVPSRDLDDLSFSCAELVQSSGAKVVWLAEPWRDESQPQVEPVASIDLLSRIEGRAVIRQESWGPSCSFQPDTAPEQVDYVLVENHYGDLKPAFRDHLERANAWEDRVKLAFFFAAVDDPRTFRMSADTAQLALFTTYRDGFGFPFSPVANRKWVDIPRDFETFEKPIRQLACRELPSADEPSCFPFR